MGILAIAEAVEGSAFSILQLEYLKVFGLTLQNLTNLLDSLVFGVTKDLLCKADKCPHTTSGEFEALEFSALFVLVITNLPALGDVLFCMRLDKCHEGVVVDDGILGLSVGCIFHNTGTCLYTGYALLD